MLKGVVIFGSARGDGNTSMIAKSLVDRTDFDLINLLDYHINYFSYSNENESDDFLDLIRNLENYDIYILVTPVYWYSMSGRMKTFLDRFSDLLKWHKPLGRSFRGKKMGAVSCGSDSGIPTGFFEPFNLTAGYLGMKYLGDVHTWISNDSISSEVIAGLEVFSRNILDEPT